MAKNIRWRVPFQSLLGRNYVVEIYDEYEGTPVTLLGAAVPFETETDDNDNFFCPVRKSTGYLRVIDNTEAGDLVEQMMPSNNIDKYVRLMEGDIIRWQGFMQAQAFSQQMDNGTREVEFPVRDLVACLYDIHASVSFNGESKILISALYYGIKDMQDKGFPVVVDDVVNNEPTEYTEQAQNFSHSWSVYYKEETIHNNNTIGKEITSKSYGDILANLCSFCGLTLWNEGTRFILGAGDYNDVMDNEVRMVAYAYTWAQIEAIVLANDSSAIDVPEMLTVTATPIDFSFRGTENNITYIPGAKKVEVRAQLANYNEGVISQDEVVETTNPIISIPLTDLQSATSGELKIQLNNDFGRREYPSYVDSLIVRDTVYEHDTVHYYYRQTLDFDSANYNKFLSNGITDPVNRYKFYYDNVHLTYSTVTCGSTLCRWGYIMGTDKQISKLESGRLLQLMSLPRGYDESSTPLTDKLATSVYGIDSAQSKIRNGYINIDFNFLPFYPHLYTGTGDVTLCPDNNASLYFLVQLRIGNMFWDGYQWVQSRARFYIRCEEGKIVANKPAGFVNDKNSGYFIPCYDYLTGIVSFDVLNIFRANDVRLDNASAFIFSNLKISNLTEKRLESNERNENCYITLLEDGFSDEISVSTDIATNNNNQDSPSLLTISGEYVDDNIQYGYNPYILLRPEEMLLTRMSNYYSKTRRKLEMSVEIPAYSNIGSLYAFNGKIYGVVSEARNWRDDSETITLLEASRFNNENI